MKLEGEIGEIDLTQRLVELWREQFTGAIRFESDGIIKIIYFKGGDVLSASTNDRADSIDEILMRAGKVTRDHVKQALAKRKESETLGDALLNLGFITRKELTWARRVQVIGVIRSITMWPNGSFTIVSDYLPKREEGTLFAAPQIIVEMIVTEQDRARFERALEGGALVYGKSDGFDHEFDRLGLNEEAARIASAIDGTRSAAEVAVASGQDAFNTYKLLHALAVLRFLERRDGGAALPPGELDFASAGVADASDAWNFDPTPPPGSTLPFDEPTYSSSDSGGPLAPVDQDLSFGTPDTHESYAAPASSSFDDAVEESSLSAAVVPPAAAALPEWTAPSRASAPMSPTPVEDPAEEKWGFDEAQIEAARKMSAPPAGAARPKTMFTAAKRKSRRGLIVALISLLVLGGVAYAGFQWWQGQQNSEIAAAAPAPRPRPAPVAATTSDTMGLPTTTDATVLAPPVPPNTVATATTSPAPSSGLTVTAPVKVPAPPPSSAATAPGRERFDTMARQFAASTTGNFAVQLVIVCETSNLEKAMRAGGENIWFVPIAVKGRSCYRVFWGRYATRDEASRAVPQVPPSLRDSRPVAVAIPKA